MTEDPLACRPRHQPVALPHRRPRRKRKRGGGRGGAGGSGGDRFRAAMGRSAVGLPARGGAEAPSRRHRGRGGIGFRGRPAGPDGEPAGAVGDRWRSSLCSRPRRAGPAARAAGGGALHPRRAGLVGDGRGLALPGLGRGADRGMGTGAHRRPPAAIGRPRLGRSRPGAEPWRGHQYRDDPLANRCRAQPHRARGRHRGYGRRAMVLAGGIAALPRPWHRRPGHGRRLGCGMG